MKKSFRFVGTEAAIILDNVQTDLIHFGKKVELSVEQLHHATGAHLLPDDDFQKIGFKEEDLLKYPTINDEARAPKEFLEKKQKARDLFATSVASQVRPIKEQSPNPATAALQGVS